MDIETEEGRRELLERLLKTKEEWPAILGKAGERQIWLLREHAALTAELAAARAEVEKLRAELQEEQANHARAEESEAKAWRQLEAMRDQHGDDRCIGRAEHHNLLGVNIGLQENVDTLRAELEALRAPLNDQQLKYIETLCEDVAEDDLDPNNPADRMHGYCIYLLRALKFERFRAAEVRRQRDDRNERLERLCTTVSELRALVEQCRPVVEAVRKWRACSCAYAACDHLTAVRDAPLPTLPEVTP